MAIFDMEKNGILVDMERGLQMSQFYIKVQNAIQARLQEELNWKEVWGTDKKGKPKLLLQGFNPRSVDHVRMALFSDTTFKDKKPHVVPENAKCLSLTPVGTTDKYKVSWETIADRNMEAKVSPSTDDETLDILQTEPTGIAKMIRYYKTTNQLTKMFLRPPISEEGQLKFDGGLLGVVRSDGRIHTHISQLKETGRWSSAKPNLQALPKAREKLLHSAALSVFPEARVEKLRTIFQAPPGWKLMEADFCQAELNVLAWLSGDKALEDVLNIPGRNLHAEMAIKGFNLDLNLTPNEVKALHSDKYIAAKSVNFGIMYKRGANSLSRETGQPVDKCQEIIKLFEADYPVAWAYLLEQERLVQMNGELLNPYGRHRRFFDPKGVSPEDLAAMQREGRNFPVQSTVADCISQAVTDFWYFRHTTLDGSRIGFKLILAIHDAILFEVPDKHVDEMKDRWIPTIMSKMNPIPKINKCLDVDIEIFQRWTEELT